MSIEFKDGTPRYWVAMVLVARGVTEFAMIAHQIGKLGPEGPTNGEIRAALTGLKRLGAVESTPAGWLMTNEGIAAWIQSREFAGTDQPAPGTSKPKHLQVQHAPELMTRSMVRLSSPANNLPFQPRPGSMDFANLPRVAGGWRIWPDGRKERLDGSKDAA